MKIPTIQEISIMATAMGISEKAYLNQLKTVNEIESAKLSVRAAMGCSSAEIDSISDKIWAYSATRIAPNIETYMEVMRSIKQRILFGQKACDILKDFEV